MARTVNPWVQLAETSVKNSEVKKFPIGYDMKMGKKDVLFANFFFLLIASDARVVKQYLELDPEKKEYSTNKS